MKLWIAISVWLIIFGICCFFIQKRIKQRTNMKQRMEHIATLDGFGRSSRAEGNKEKNTPDTLDKKALAFVKRVAEKFNGVKDSQAASSMDIKMQQADWPLLGTEFLVILAILAVGAGLIVGLLTLELPPALIAATGADIIALLIVQITIKRRRKSFTNQLGDMLTMVANALRAGFSFLQAFELVAREMDDPVKAEVNKVVRDIGIGMSLEAALENMNKRIYSPEFELVVTAVLIQRQVGGNMAQILDNISSTINERIRMKREVMALTAQGRASGVVLAGLPFAAAVLLSAINPGYLDPLLASSTGKMAIAGGIVMEILGWLTIEKIVNIDM